jgi:hypothetical protein
MWLEAIVTRDDLAELLEEVHPLKIHLEPNEDQERWIELGRPQDVSLVRDVGLRVTCPARLQWTVIGTHPTIMIDSLTMLLRPTVVQKSRGHVLDLHVQIDEADVRGLPSFLDATIVKAVNVALAAKSLSWNFTETLTHKVGLPASLDPLDSLQIQVTWGERRIGTEAVVLVVSFRLHVVRND